MLNVKTLSILAIAGSAAALPQWGPWGAGKYFSGNRGDGDDAAATALEIVTAYVTVTYSGGWNGNYGGGHRTSSAAVSSTAAPSPAAVESSAAPVAPAPSSSTPVATFAPAPSSSTSSTPVAIFAPSTPTPVASSTTSAAPVASSSSSSSSGGYMAIVNKWRVKMSMSELTESDTLQANALKTVTDSNGQMVHELNPGSFAQVLAPGNADNFENVFVGGWLCERPDLPGLDGICATMSQGWAYDGQTGHADILSSTAYSKIGCALYAGIWGCDLA